MGSVTAGPSAREQSAQQIPPADVDLGTFPVRRIVPGSVVFRAHRVERGPWWFGSDGTGRFDLVPPRGTCYVAEAAVVAVRERIGIVLGTRRRVPSATLHGIVVSRLAVDDALAVANLRVARANDFGVLNELASMVPYDVPQAWALALASAGHDGVRYPARFSTGRAGAVAIFGPGGGRPSWAVDPAPVAAAEVPGAPVLRDPPRLDELTVVAPPRRRATRGGRHA